MHKNYSIHVTDAIFLLARVNETKRGILALVLHQRFRSMVPFWGFSSKIFVLRLHFHWFVFMSHFITGNWYFHMKKKWYFYMISFTWIVSGFHIHVWETRVEILFFHVEISISFIKLCFWLHFHWVMFLFCTMCCRFFLPFP